MTSKRNIKNWIEELEAQTSDDPIAKVCAVCGGAPPGTGAEMGVTAEFVKVDCDCEPTAPDGWVEPDRDPDASPEFIVVGDGHAGEDV